ncbi:MAG: DUF86 domain-containing protein [Chloroflexi bacterium]|nr:DUF86 domain-containing protein [Chloroflexota bacterium]
MARDDLRKYLFDILAAAQLIDTFTKGKDLDAYLQDPLLQSAVERQLAIIGEAMNQALRVAPSLEQRIHNARRIIALRNRLIHAYASIAHDIVWSTACHDVPILYTEVRAHMLELEGSE